MTFIGHTATKVAFINCTPFTKCITKINGRTIDDAKELDLVMPIYNFIEQIILIQQSVYNFIPKMKQLLLMLILHIIITIILNLLTAKIKYYQIQLLSLLEITLMEF